MNIEVTVLNTVVLFENWQATCDCMITVLFDAHDADAALYSIGKVIALDTSIIVNQFRAATPMLRWAPCWPIPLLCGGVVLDYIDISDILYTSFAYEQTYSRNSP